MVRLAKPAQDAVSPLTLRLALMALVPFGLGYFMSYLFRAVNAVVATDLVRDLGLTASELGLLTSAYLLAFALWQLPLGILLDQYGPRRVQTVLLLVAALGAVLFALGQNALYLTIARGLIGVGVAGGLMSGFKAVVLWVPEPRRALANSYVMSLGAIGLLVSTVPTELAVVEIGWRGVFLVLAAVTALVALSIFLIVPERPGTQSPDSLRSQIGIIGGIYSDRAFLALAPVLAATAGVHIGIQTLWAGTWFRDVAGLDRAGVAHELFLMAAAFFVGILASGAIADWFVRRGVGVLTVMLGFLLVFLLAQALIVFDIAILRRPAWLAFGMSGQVAILAYPWLSSYFGAKRSGRANTAMNLVIFGSAFAIQYIAGWIIDFYPRTPSGGYPPASYQTAFGFFLVIELLALAWFVANRKRFEIAPAARPA
jgi:MFS family permease